MARKTDTGQNRKIKAAVDMMFDDIPYSEEVTQAQEKIESALNSEFDKSLFDEKFIVFEIDNIKNNNLL